MPINPLRFRLSYRFLHLLGAIFSISFVDVTLADPRADFLKIVDRPRVPLAIEIKETTAKPPLGEYAFSYASDKQDRVPGILVKRVGSFLGRRPVIIALHGTGGTKNDELPLLRTLATQGFIGVAIDGRYHGERTKAGKGSAEYQDAILRVWRANDPAAHHTGDVSEHPFYYDTVWDVMRLIDYLDQRDDVDPSRIGLYGVSKGGIETYLTAAVDTRVAVAVPCIGLESFKWADDNNSWQGRIGTIQNAFDSAAREAHVASPGADFVKAFYARVVPGIDGEFDGPAMVKLISPRPLLAINSDTDPHTPLPGVQLCIDSAKQAYNGMGITDRAAFRIQPHTGHKVNADSQAAAVDWFIRWLNP